MFFKLFALSTMLFVSQSGYDEANTFVASIFGIVPMTGWFWLRKYATDKLMAVERQSLIRSFHGVRTA